MSGFRKRFHRSQPETSRDILFQRSNLRTPAFSHICVAGFTASRLPEDIGTAQLGFSAKVDYCRCGRSSRPAHPAATARSLAKIHNRTSNRRGDQSQQICRTPSAFCDELPLGSTAQSDYSNAAFTSRDPCAGQLSVSHCRKLALTSSGAPLKLSPQAGESWRLLRPRWHPSAAAI